MDKEEKKAYIAVRERIAKEIDNNIATGGSPNDLKRLRRYGSSFGWYPHFYPEILANHGEMTTKQLIGALRGPEEKIMKDLVPIKGMPLHHAVANRTGGDAAFRAPADVWLETRDRLIQKYQREFGNSGINLNPSGAIDERMHQGRRGSKGTVFDPKLGYGADPVPDLPILHGAGQKNIGESIGKGAAGMTADELFTQLDPVVGKQIADLDIVLENPTTIAQRKIVTDVAPSAFSPTATPKQQAAIRKQLVETGTDVKFAQAFDPNKGRMGKQVLQNLRQQAQLARMGKLAKVPGGKAFMSAIPIVGLGFGAIEAKERGEKAAKTKNPVDALQATLSTAGLTPGVGIVPDLANVVIDSFRFAMDNRKIKNRSNEAFLSGSMK